MLDRIGAVMVKEVRQLARDRLTFGMIVGIPLMQMLLFGYAINFDVRNLRAAVVDEAGTSLSRALVADLQASGVVEFAAPSAGVGELRRRMSAGEISVGVISRRISSGGVLDGTAPGRPAAGGRQRADGRQRGARPRLGAAAAARRRLRQPRRRRSRCAPSTTRSDAPPCRSCRR